MHQLHSAVKSELEACEEDIEEFKAREAQSKFVVFNSWIACDLWGCFLNWGI